MEHEAIKYADVDVEVEDGELSDSDDGYTPLQRPCMQNSQNEVATASISAVTKMEETSEQDESLPEQSSDSSDSESKFNANAKMSKLRIKPFAKQPTTNTNFKKNNIWSSDLQEESLMENLKSCEVDQKSTYDRSIESYDYNLKYRLNGENALKRRQSNSDDSESNFHLIKNHKRFRASSFGSREKKKNVHQRLGHRSDDSSSNDGAKYAARRILDLAISSNSSNELVARDIASKLCEKNDDLMLRIVNVLGKEIAAQLFKETQKIESDGGMLIMSRARRRTPGGVYLFLLKNCDKITNEQKTQIFLDQTKNAIKDKKIMQALKRDRKVEQLKKTLKNENDLTVLSTRSELALTHLNAETHANLSNPPPSPVTDCNHENSSDFDTNEIQHVNVTSPEKVFPKIDTQNGYDDDFLDMHCDDMDLF